MASTLTETHQDDDRVAAAAAQRGESDGALRAARDAFERLYRLHAPLLLAFIAARVRPEDREDLHQEVWQRAWQHLPDQFHGGNFRAWLHEIARHLIIDAGRKRKAEALTDSEGLVDGRHKQGDQCLIERERKLALERCLDRLKATAAALVRARLAGEDYATVSERLGLTPAQAHKQFHLAKSELKTCIERALG
jgi:RNA polymerase sigma-70 factor (ECF subfamily)